MPSRSVHSLTREVDVSRSFVTACHLSRISDSHWLDASGVSASVSSCLKLYPSLRHRAAAKKARNMSASQLLQQPRVKVSTWPMQSCDAVTQWECSPAYSAVASAVGLIEAREVTQATRATATRATATRALAWMASGRMTATAAAPAPATATTTAQSGQTGCVYC